MKNKVSKLRYKRLRHCLAIPFILGMALPLLALDMTLETYHRIAFPLYGLSIVPRRNYVRIDRHKLSYLGWADKAWCVYCGYANGLLAYAVVVAGKTEGYWCGVKHKPGGGYIPPAHHNDFLEYNDQEAYKNYLKQ